MSDDGQPLNLDRTLKQIDRDAANHASRVGPLPDTCESSGLDPGSAAGKSLRRGECRHWQEREDANLGPDDE
jgi:hypothetical protein